MPKQVTANHTRIKHFRLGPIAERRLEESAEILGVDQTTAIKLAIQQLHARLTARKNFGKSDPVS